MCPRARGGAISCVVARGPKARAGVGSKGHYLRSGCWRSAGPGAVVWGRGLGPGEMAWDPWASAGAGFRGGGLRSGFWLKGIKLPWPRG